MFHWMLVAPQALNSVLLIEDSFFNKEMRTFSRIRAHQPTSEIFTTRLWRRKTKPWYVNLIDCLYCLFAFTVAKHDTTSTNDALDFSIFWTFSLKATRHNCKCLNVYRVRSENFQKKRFRTTVGFSMDMEYEYEAANIWSVLGKVG